jgi:hypothetical protein
LQNCSIDLELLCFFFLSVGIEIAINDMVIVVWNLMKQIMMHALVDVELCEEAEYLNTVQRKLGTQQNLLVLLEEEFYDHLKRWNNIIV